MNLKEQYKQATRLFADGRHEQAHKSCMAILGEDPRFADAYYLLALIAVAYGNYVKAVEVLDRAIAFDETGRPAYMAEKAKCLLALNQHDKAKASIEECADMPNHSAITLDTVGVLFSRLGDHERAVAYFWQAVSIDAEQAEIHYNLGASLQFLGRFAEADASYERAIQLQSDMVKAHSALSQLSRQTTDSNHIQRLVSLWDRVSGVDDRLHVGHALAKEYEDLEDYDSAFKYLCLAKEQKREAVAYSIESAKQLFVAAKNGFSKLPESPVTGSDEPIFIVGMPRTGTTLVERIMSSHSGVMSAGELPNFSLVLKRQAGTSSPLVLDSETLEAAASLELSKLGADYVESTRPRTGGSLHFIDKMPFNFFYAGIISRALPKAKVIALVRNPMDTCLSNYRQLFSTRFPYYDYAYSLEDSARFYAMFLDLMSFWQASLGERFTTVRYEELVDKPEQETRRLLEFCNLPFEEACLSFHRNTAPVSTASSVQVRQPLYRSAVDRWRKYGDNLRPLMEALEAQGVSVS